MDSQGISAPPVVQSIDKLAAALSKAQEAIEHAQKDSNNPHFNSSFASLASVIDACRKPLAANGLSVVQYPARDGSGWVLVTRLMHSSGQWIEGHNPVLSAKQDAQGFGSGLTYARRYGLAAMVGVAQSDDDGAAATTSHSPPASPPQATSKAIFNHAPSAKGKLSEAQVKRLWAIANSNGWSRDEAQALILKVGNVQDAASLTKASYDQVCGTLEMNAPPSVVKDDSQIPF